MTKILIEPLWKLRREYYNWQKCPIDGYEFVIPESRNDGVIKRLAGKDWAYDALHRLGRVIPVNLLKPALETHRNTNGAALTYSVLHTVFRDEPWILDMRLEQPHLLAGSERMFRLYKGVIRRQLMSENCRAIICELEAGRQALLQYFPELKDKVKVVHSTMPVKHFTKDYMEKPITKLLFVNSANINAGYHFAAHGGLILLEAFKILWRQGYLVELVIRSGMTPEMKRSLVDNPAIKVYDKVISWEVLEHEFQTADIFVYPTHVTPSIVFLDAMSYELPIVTTDVWGNGEIVRNREMGILAYHKNATKFTDKYIVHFDSPEFKEAVFSVDKDLAYCVAEKVACLIDNPEMRRHFGENGRHQIETGDFSYEQWANGLKKVLDEVLSKKLR